jgi:hypothetical protein
MGKLICLNEFFLESAGRLIYPHQPRVAFHSRPLKELETVLHTLLSSLPNVLPLIAFVSIQEEILRDGLEQNIIQTA